MGFTNSENKELNVWKIWLVFIHIHGMNGGSLERNKKCTAGKRPE